MFRLSIKPVLKPRLLLRAHQYLKQGDKESVKTFLQQALLDKSSSVAPAASYLGWLYFEEKHIQEAINYFRLAHEVIPTDTALKHNYFAALYQSIVIEKNKGDYDAAKQQAEKLIKAAEMVGDNLFHSYACTEIANMAFIEKKHAACEYYLKQAIAVNPYNIEAKIMLADIEKMATDYHRSRSPHAL